MFKVSFEGGFPKKKFVFHPGEFETRRQAVQWCRKRTYLGQLRIHHPDGTIENFAKTFTL